MTKEAEELLSKLDHNLNDILFDLVDENETLEGQVNELREQVARLTENKGELIDTKESENQSVEWYCTDCPYFQFTGDPTDYWYGAKCNKDNHEVNPSMMAIEELNKNCPLNRGVNE